MKVYADTSLIALRPAVEKVPWSVSEDDAQRDAQKSDLDRLLRSLAVTVSVEGKSDKSVVDMGLKSLSVTEWPGVAMEGEWLQRQGSAL